MVSAMISQRDYRTPERQCTSNRLIILVRRAVLTARGEASLLLRQTERVRLPPHALLRKNESGSCEVSERAHRKDLEFPTGILVCGLPIVPFRRKPHARIHDSAITYRSRFNGSVPLVEGAL